MQHRHLGPPVSYRTRRGRTMSRKRPLHKITPGRRVRKHFFRDDIDPIEKVFTKEGRVIFGVPPGEYEDDKEEEGRRGSRRFSFSDRERHLDNINQLQDEIKELKEEMEDKQNGIQDLNKSAIRFDRDRFKNFSEEERKNLSMQDINEIFESEPNPYEVDTHQLIEEERDFENQIEQKLKAIEEEREFLDEDE